MRNPHKLNTDSNRNTKNIKIAVENDNLCGENMQYAHFAEICEKCGNMQQSHIRIKLTCVTGFLKALLYHSPQNTHITTPKHRY